MLDIMTATEKWKEMQQELHCSICHEYFAQAYTLSCSHSFCLTCINAWKQGHSDCPICRRDISGMAPSRALDNMVATFQNGINGEAPAARNNVGNEASLPAAYDSISSHAPLTEETRNVGTLFDSATDVPQSRGNQPQQARSVNLRDDSDDEWETDDDVFYDEGAEEYEEEDETYEGDDSFSGGSYSAEEAEYEEEEEDSEGGEEEEEEGGEDVDEEEEYDESGYNDMEDSGEANPDGAVEEDFDYFSSYFFDSNFYDSTDYDITDFY